MSFYLELPLEELAEFVQRNPDEVDLRMALIKRLAQDRNMEEAMDQIYDAEEHLPDNLEILASKAICLLSAGAIEEGYDLLQKVVRRDPCCEIQHKLLNEILPAFSDADVTELTDPDTLREKAEAADLQGQFVDRLESVIEIMGAIADHPGDPAIGREMLAEHVDRFPSDINAKLDLARLYMAEQIYDKSAEMYHNVVLADPECSPAFFEWGTITNDPTTAVDLTKEGLALCPKHIVGRYNLGIMLMQIRQYSDARMEFARIPGDDPYYASGLAAIAESFHEEGNMEMALEFMEKVAILTPNDSDALNNFGHILSCNGQNEMALDVLEKAISLNPEHTDALYNIGVVLTAMERLDEALATYEKALEISADDPLTINNIAFVMSKLDRYDDAIDTLVEGLETHPNCARMWMNLGSYYCSNDQLDQSLAASQRAINLDPERAVAYWNLACVYAKRDQRDLCLSQLELAVGKSPTMAKNILIDKDLEAYWKDAAFLALVENASALDDLQS